MTDVYVNTVRLSLNQSTTKYSTLHSESPLRRLRALHGIFIIPFHEQPFWWAHSISHSSSNLHDVQRILYLFLPCWLMLIQSFRARKRYPMFVFSSAAFLLSNWYRNLSFSYPILSMPICRCLYFRINTRYKCTKYNYPPLLHSLAFTQSPNHEIPKFKPDSNFWQWHPWCIECLSKG